MSSEKLKTFYNFEWDILSKQCATVHAVQDIVVEGSFASE
jgi:hypothetical protein